MATVTPGSPIDLNLTLASGFEFSLEAQFEVAVKVAGIQDFASIDDVCIQSQRRSMKMNCDARGGTASFKSMVLPLVPGTVTDAIFFYFNYFIIRCPGGSIEATLIRNEQERIISSQDVLWANINVYQDSGKILRSKKLLVALPGMMQGNSRSSVCVISIVKEETFFPSFPNLAFCANSKADTRKEETHEILDMSVKLESDGVKRNTYLFSSNELQDLFGNQI